MKLEPKSKVGDMIDCYCELTTTLDELSGLTDKKSLFKHYIMVDGLTKRDQCMAIRVPGGTVGAIYYNDDKIITDIVIDTNYVIKSYVENVNEIIKEKYVGIIIE